MSRIRAPVLGIIFPGCVVNQRNMKRNKRIAANKQEENSDTLETLNKNEYIDDECQKRDEYCNFENLQLTNFFPLSCILSSVF